MTPKLLILVLTASLIAPQVHCETVDSSGDAEAVLQDPEVTTLDIKVEGVTSHAISAAQVNTTSTRHPPTPAQTPKKNQTEHTELQEPIGPKEANHPRRIASPSLEEPPLDSTETNGTEPPNTEDEGDTSMFIALAATLVLVLILAVVVAVVICRRRRAKAAALKEDLYLDAEGREKVPMPMFEDDVPSVLELEMEDLEKWMIKRDGGFSTDSEQKQFS